MVGWVWITIFYILGGVITSYSVFCDWDPLSFILWLVIWFPWIIITVLSLASFEVYSYVKRRLKIK
jgi:hypothetical protein